MPRGRKPKYPSGLTIGQFLLLDQPHHWVRRCEEPPLADEALTDTHVSEALDRPFGIPNWPEGTATKHVEIEVLDLPSRAVGPLAEMGVRTVDDLLAVEREELLSKRRLGVISVNRIRCELLDLLFPPFVGPPARSVPPFDEMVRGFVHRTIDDPRRQRLAMGRLAPRRAKPLPLKAFGEELGISRERIDRSLKRASIDWPSRPRWRFSIHSGLRCGRPLGPLPARWSLGCWRQSLRAIFGGPQPRRQGRWSGFVNCIPI